MTFGNAQIHLCIANHGESLLGSNLMLAILYTDMLKRELLLVHGCRSKQGRFNTLPEPSWCDVTGITDFLYALDLVTDTL